MTKKRSIAIGPLSGKDTGSHWAPEKAVFSQPERVTNASPMQPRYKPPVWASARPGADDHKQHKTLGLI